MSKMQRFKVLTMGGETVIITAVSFTRSAQGITFRGPDDVFLSFFPYNNMIFIEHLGEAEEGNDDE